MCLSDMKQNRRSSHLGAFGEIKNYLENSDGVHEGDFIDLYLDKIIETEDESSSFHHSHGLRSLDCVLIDLFIGMFVCPIIHSHNIFIYLGILFN